MTSSMGIGDVTLVGLVQNDSVRRPRAFGRNSNFWQYVDTVHGRRTPPAQLTSASRRSSIDSEFEDPNGFEDPKPNEVHRGSRKSSDKSRKLEPIPMRRGTMPRLKSISSVPDLDNNNSNSGGGRRGSAYGLAPSPTTVISSPPFTGNAPRHPVNGHDVIRRIQALGTSASAPYLSSTQNNSPLGTQQAVPSNNSTGSQGLPQATSSGLSDAEVFRNDFNSQTTRLYYGCSIALELFNGDLLLVRSPEGKVRVQPLEHMTLKGPTGGTGKDRAVFTLIDMTDLRSAGSIRYGDAVWLQLSVGPGEISWEQGGVLGAKVREAPQLQALALADDLSIRNDGQIPTVVGYPTPVKAYLPKNRDDTDAQVDEIQSRVRNKSSRMLGKWILRSALCSSHKTTDNYVYNNDEIYLEQDWFYLGADSENGLAVLRQLPSVSKDIKAGDYVVERRAAWRIRLLDSSNGSSGLSLAQQQMERLLLRAKTQLKQSHKMRTGQLKIYTSHNTEIPSGAAFTNQIRLQRIQSTIACDQMYLQQQEERLQDLSHHFINKTEMMQEGQTQRIESPLPLRLPHTISNPLPLGPVISVCSLCQSTTIAFNLCCQIHHVMKTLQTEIEHAKHPLTTTRSSRVTTPLETNHHLLEDHHKKSTLDIIAHAITVANHPEPIVTGQARMTQLFQQQDAKMLDIIKYRDKELKAEQAAAEQARVGVSPAARYRYKTNIGTASEQIKCEQGTKEETQDGIGRHYQLLHAQLDREESLRRASQMIPIKKETHVERYCNEVEEEEIEKVWEDTTLCPLEYPGEGMEQQLESSLVPRLFPTLEEMELLPPIDTKHALELYLQNKGAVIEMMDGYMDLLDTQIIPNLTVSIETRNRTTLVEFLDFTARASEFICARRIQVRVAELLHVISASSVGNFEAIDQAYSILLQEIEGTKAFITFYRGTSPNKHKKR